VVPVVIDSNTTDFIRSAAGGTYAALTDSSRRIVANSFVRRAELVGGGQFRTLSLDQCQEDQVTRTGWPCTPVLAADRDRLEYGWFGTVSSTRFGSEFNPASPTVPLDLLANFQGSNSLMFPGTTFRFQTGPSVPYTTGPWASLVPPATPGLPRGEADGFRVTAIRLVPQAGGAQGNGLPPTFTPHERITGVVLGGGSGLEDSFHFLIPISSDPHTVAIWANGAVETATGFGGGGSFTAQVYARCGAKPTATVFDYLRPFTNNPASTTTGDSPVFLRLQNRPDGSLCTSGWNVVIRNVNAGNVAFDIRVERNLSSREYVNISVGIEVAVPAAELAQIRFMLREAAWRLYGMTGGATLLRSYLGPTNGVCDGVDVCIRSRPVGRCPDRTGITVQGTPLATTHLCWNTSRFLTTGLPDEHEAAALLAHEYGHFFHQLGDEYWISSDVAQICGRAGAAISRCTHSTMTLTTSTITSLCTPRTHDSTVEWFNQAADSPPPFANWAVTRGPNTITECWNGQVNQAGPWGSSGWAQLNASGTVPVAHADVSPDNFNYLPFRWMLSIGPPGWDVGRTP
jgi:hypothetical protein